MDDKKKELYEYLKANNAVSVSFEEFSSNLQDENVGASLYGFMKKQKMLSDSYTMDSFRSEFIAPPVEKKNQLVSGLDSGVTSQEPIQEPSIQGGQTGEWHAPLSPGFTGEVQQIDPTFPIKTPEVAAQDMRDLREQRKAQQPVAEQAVAPATEDEGFWSDVKNSLSATWKSIKAGLIDTPETLQRVQKESARPLLRIIEQNLTKKYNDGKLTQAEYQQQLADARAIYEQGSSVPSDWIKSVRNKYTDLDQLAEDQRREAEVLRDRVKNSDKMVTELWQAGDRMGAVRKAATEAIGSLPYAGVASVPVIGPYLIGASTATEKLQQLDEEATGASERAKLTNAFVTGLAEGVGESVSAGLLKAAKDMVMDLGKDAMQRVFKERVKDYAKALGVSLASESSSEAISTLVENIADKVTTNPDKDILEGVLDAAIVGAVAGGGISATGIAGREARIGAQKAMTRAEAAAPAAEAEVPFQQRTETEMDFTNFVKQRGASEKEVDGLFDEFIAGLPEDQRERAMIEQRGAILDAKAAVLKEAEAPVQVTERSVSNGQRTWTFDVEPTQEMIDIAKSRPVFTEREQMLRSMRSFEMSDNLTEAEAKKLEEMKSTVGNTTPEEWAEIQRKEDEDNTASQRLLELENAILDQQIQTQDATQKEQELQPQGGEQQYQGTEIQQAQAPAETDLGDRPVDGGVQQETQAPVETFTDIAIAPAELEPSPEWNPPAFLYDEGDLSEETTVYDADGNEYTFIAGPSATDLESMNDPGRDILAFEEDGGVGEPDWSKIDEYDDSMDGFDEFMAMEETIPAEPEPVRPSRFTFPTAQIIDKDGNVVAADPYDQLGKKFFTRNPVENPGAVPTASDARKVEIARLKAEIDAREQRIVEAVKNQPAVAKTEPDRNAEIKRKRETNWNLATDPDIDAVVKPENKAKLARVTPLARALEAVGVKVKVHESNTMITEELGDQVAGGFFSITNAGDPVIVVDLDSMSDTTLNHESVHAILYAAGLRDPKQILELAKEIAKHLDLKKEIEFKGTRGTLQSYLEAFTSQYEAADRPEEMLAELGALMSAGVEAIKPGPLKKIEAAINKFIQKITGNKDIKLTLSSNRDAIDFFQTLARGIATADVATLEQAIQQGRRISQQTGAVAQLVEQKEITASEEATKQAAKISKANKRTIDGMTRESKTKRKYNFVGKRIDRKARGVGAFLDALEMAQNMDIIGEHPYKIFFQTGWMKGLDGHWRMEIDSNEMKFKPHEIRNGDFMTLSELISYHTLFTMYPEMEDIVVKFDFDMEGDIASYNPQNDIITIGFISKEQELSSTLLHEIQHAIQRREMFDDGSNAEEALRSQAFFIRDMNEEIDNAIKEKSGMIDTYKDMLGKDHPMTQGLLKDISDLRIQKEMVNRMKAEDPYEAYRRDAGEVEARNVETRYFMNYDQKRGTPFDWTEDVPRGLQRSTGYIVSPEKMKIINPSDRAMMMDMAELEARVAQDRAQFLKDYAETEEFSIRPRSVKMEIVGKHTGFRSVESVFNMVMANDPSYLGGVMESIRKMRAKLKAKQLKPADVAKALVMTVASMRSGIVRLGTVTSKVGFKNIDQIFIDPYHEKNGGTSPGIRPEGMAAFLLTTRNGRRFLEEVNKGKLYTPFVNDFIEGMKPFGNHEMKVKWLFGEGSPVTQLQSIVDKMHEATSDTEFFEAAKMLRGIGESKAGFISQFLGVASRGVVDIRQANLWARGLFDPDTTGIGPKEIAREVQNNGEISGEILRRIGLVAERMGLPKEDAYIAHHAIWDAVNGQKTSHDGLYAVMTMTEREFDSRARVMEATPAEISKSVKKKFEKRPVLAASITENPNFSAAVNLIQANEKTASAKLPYYNDHEIGRVLVNQYGFSPAEARTVIESTTGRLYRAAHPMQVDNDSSFAAVMHYLRTSSFSKEGRAQFKKFLYAIDLQWGNYLVGVRNLQKDFEESMQKAMKLAGIDGKYSVPDDIDAYGELQRWQSKSAYLLMKERDKFLGDPESSESKKASFIGRVAKALGVERFNEYLIAAHQEERYDRILDRSYQKIIAIYAKMVENREDILRLDEASRILSFWQIDKKVSIESLEAASKLVKENGKLSRAWKKEEEFMKAIRQKRADAAAYKDKIFTKLGPDGVNKAREFYKELKREVLDRTVDILEDANILDAKRAELLRLGASEDSNVGWNNYVPLLIDDEAYADEYGHYFSPLEGVANNPVYVDVINAGIRGVTGNVKFGEQDIQSPLNVAFARMGHAIFAAQQNKARQTLGALMEQYPAVTGTVGGQKGLPDPRYQVISSRAVPKVNEFGEVVGRDDYMPARQKEQSLQFRDRDGKLKYIYFSNPNDPILIGLKSMKGREDVVATGFMNGVRFLNNIFRPLYTMYNPSFIVANAFRDVQDALASLGLEGKGIRGLRTRYIKNVGKTAAFFMGNTLIARGFGIDNATDPGWRGQMFKDWVEMQEQGARMSWAMLSENPSMDMKRLQELIDDTEALSTNKEKNGAKIKRNMAKLLTGLHQLSDFSENLNRLATYTTMKEAGLTAGQAANIAKNITINFEKKGASKTAQTLNTLYMFLNVGIQGVRRFGKMLAHPEGRRAIGYMIALAAANRMLLYAMAGDDEEKEFDLQNYLYNESVSRNKVLVANPLDSRNPITIPKPYGMVRLSYTIGEGIVDMLRGMKTPLDVAFDIFKDGSSAIDPIGGGSGSIVNYLPVSGARPLWSVAINQDWMGRQILRTFSQEYVPDHEVYYKTTPGWAVGFAKGIADRTGPIPVLGPMFDASPVYWNFLAESYMTNLGPMKFLFRSAENVEEYAKTGDTLGFAKDMLFMNKVLYKDMSKDEKQVMFNFFDVIQKPSSGGITKDQLKYIEKATTLMQEKELIKENILSGALNELSKRYPEHTDFFEGLK